MSRWVGFVNKPRLRLQLVKYDKLYWPKFSFNIPTTDLSKKLFNALILTWGSVNYLLNGRFTLFDLFNFFVFERHWWVFGRRNARLAYILNLVLVSMMSLFTHMRRTPNNYKCHNASLYLFNEPRLIHYVSFTFFILRLKR